MGECVDGRGSIIWYKRDSVLAPLFSCYRDVDEFKATVCLVLQKKLLPSRPK